MKVASACVVLAFGIVGVVPEAHAAGPATNAAQPAEFARMRYRQGVDAYKAGRYREAVDYFLEADTLAPNAALSFNIARAYEKLDDAPSALRWYRDYQRRAPDAKDKTETDTIIHGLETRLQAKGVQQVTLLSTPPGASAAIDDRVVGVTPITVEIPPGTHRVELRLDGHENASTTLELAPDKATDVSLALTPSRTAPAVPAAPAPTSAAPSPQGGPASSPQKDEGGSSFPYVPVGWTVAGVGGASLAAALAFEISRRSAETDAKHETTQIGYADKLHTMEGRQTAARVFAAVGAGLAITGGVLVWLGSGKPGKSPSVTAACVPGACWSTVKGSF